MKKLKAVLYWVSVVPVVIDLFRAAVRGVQLGLDDLRRERENERFRRANTELDDE